MVCTDQPHRCVSLRDCDRKPWPAHRDPPVTLTAFHNRRACNSHLKPRQLARGRIERGRFVIQLLHCNAQQQFCSTSDSFIDNKWPYHVVLCYLSHCLSFTFSSSGYHTTRLSHVPKDRSQGPLRPSTCSCLLVSLGSRKLQACKACKSPQRSVGKASPVLSTDVDYCCTG